MTSVNRLLNIAVNRDLHESQEPNHVYVDLSTTNQDFGLKDPVPLIFKDTRDTAFLKDPQAYYLSVVRFTIDTGLDLPAFIPEIMPGQSDINKCIYSFTFKYKTYLFQSHVNFITQNLNAKLPQAPDVNGGMDLSTGYYNVSNYAYFVKLLNSCLDSTYTGLKELVEADGDTLPSNYAPFLLFDTTSGEVIFNSDAAGYDIGLENPIFVYMNTPMSVLLGGFNTFLNTYSDPNGLNYMLIIQNENNTNVLELDLYNCIQTYAEYNACANWNAVTSIVLCSSTLPINGTLQTQPVKYNSSTTLNNNGSNFSMNIISDFAVTSSTGLNEYRPSCSYTATGQYRLIDLWTRNPLTQIAIEVYYRDRFNNFHQLYLSSSCSANLKIMFRKKNLGV